MEDMHYEIEQQKRQEKSLYTELEQHTPQGAVATNGDDLAMQAPEPRKEKTWGQSLLAFKPSSSGQAMEKAAGTDGTPQPAGKPADDIGGFLERTQEKMRIWRGEGFSFSPAEADAYRSIVGASKDKEAASSRFIDAMGYAGRMGLSVADAWNNLDAISRFWTGQDYKADDSTFAQNVKAGFDRIETGKLKQRLQACVLDGRMDEAERLHQQIMEREAAMPNNGIPVSWLQHVKEVVATNIGYNVDIWAHAAAGNAAMYTALGLMVKAAHLNPVTAIAVDSTVALAAATYGKAMAFQRTKEMQSAEAFYDMYYSGGQPNATKAMLLAEADGAITGFLETFVDGVTSKGIGMLTGNQASRIGLGALVDLSLRGTGKRAAKVLGEWVTGAIDEAFLNEFPEKFTEDVRGALYRSWIGLPSGFDLKQTFGDALREAADGAIVGIIYGGLAIPGSMKGKKVEAVGLRRVANSSLTKEEFYAATEDLKPEDVSKEDFDTARNEIFDASRKQMADLSKDLSRQDEEGFSRYTEEAGSALGATGIGKDGHGRRTMVFQSNEDLEAAYDSLRALAASSDISMDGKHAVLRFMQKTENGNTAYQELVLTTREDEVAEGMHVPEDTFEDDVADMELERPLSVAMLDQDSAVSAQEVRALRTKLRDNYGITGRKNKAAAQAYAVASSILHVPSLDLADRLRIVFEGDEAARAELRGNGFSEERGANGWMTNEGGGFTIHLTRTATPATLFHETGHIVRALASADQLADVERVYGVQGHQWTRNAEERFADDFVRYLRTRQAPTAKIRYLFDQIKNLLSYITGGKYNDNLSDETARAFERLWTGKADEGVLKENNLRQIKTPTERRTGSNSTIASKPDSVKGTQFELTDTPSMAEVRRKYEGTDKWLKAPNGKQTNLTERQWLQVRTPEFKRWFGDWEADPEHASKVVDGNGEPLVVDGVFLSLDSDAVLRKIQARKLQAEVLAGRIRDAERDSGARYGTMDFAYANPEVSEDIALGADDVRLLAVAIYKGNAPELVVGFRYGDIPKAMMSYNHRDQYLEAGVSIVGRVRDLDTRKSGFYEMLLGNEPYNVVVGLYAGNHGADGEMLLAPVYKLGLASDVGKLAKSATDNNGQFSAGNDSILFELAEDEEVSPKTLFELTDEQRDGFVKKWRTDVERAVRGYEVVPTRVLEQFRGEDWADEELALREAVMDDPELWRMAEEAQDPDQLRQTLKDALVDEQEMEDNPLYDEEEIREHKRQRELLQQALASLSTDGKGATGDWVARLYWYTRTKTQDERDQEFLRTYASGKEGVLKLKAAIGKGYQTPVLSKRVHSKTGDKTYYGMQNHWPAYKGISQKVLHLPADATDAQVQEAIDKIRENPRRYRQVLDFVESNNAYAQTVMEGMGRGEDGIMDSYQARTAAIESDEDLKKLEASGAKTLAQLSDEERNTPVGQLAGTGDEKESQAVLARNKQTADKKAGEAKAAADETKAKLEKEQKETARQQKAIEKYKKSLDDFLDQTNKELDGKGKAKAGRDAKAYKTKYQALLRKLWLENERKPDYDRLKQNADFLQAYGEEKARQVTQKQTEIWNLEKDLEDRRKRVRVLRRELTEANETARKLEEHSASLERRLSASRVRQAARALIASIKRLSGPSDSIDADVNGALSIVRQVTGSKLAVGQETAIESDAGTYGAKGLSQLEFYLAQTDHPEVAGLIRDRVRTSQWTVEQLLALREAVRTMRKDAREALASRQARTRMRRQGVLAGYFKELTGQNAPVYAMTDSQGNINPKGGQFNPYAMRDDIIRSIPEADRTDSAVKKFWNSYRGVWAKMQRVARILDGDREGVLYDFLVRQAYFANTAQIRNVNARLADGGEAMRRFGVTAEQLDEKLYTYEKGATKVELTRGEVIGLYVYGQNEIEAKKLYSISGNGISPLEAADAISKLTEGEKAWGDWMISDFARNRERIEQAYYEQFNKELGSRDRYFPMVGDGTKVGVGEEDTLAGPTAIKREQQRTRVNRDFTKEANENAIYPLKLDVTGSWYSQVAKEEHFLAWNEWVQDAQFLLGQTGGLAGMIRQKYGKAMASSVQEYVNDMAYTFTQMSDFERMLNALISHSAIGSLAYNLVTILKQAPSMAASIGHTSMRNWMKAALALMPKRRAQTLQMIYDKAPDIVKRYVDLDVMRVRGRTGKLGRLLDQAGKSEKPWQGMWGAQSVDRAVVAQMWLASYWTNLEDGMGEQEAVFKASQLVAETQPTSQPTDLAYAQRKWKDPLRRAAIMFTNQTFQLWNMACIDLPMYLRQREFSKAVPILANITLNALAMTLISGAFLGKGGNDDDEKRRRRILKEMLAALTSSAVPLAGGALAEEIKGFYGSDDSLSVNIGRMMGRIADGSLRMKDVIDLAKDAGSSFVGTPTNLINRTTKAVTSGEILYLLGPNWGDWQKTWK